MKSGIVYAPLRRSARGAETCPVDEDIHGSEVYKRHLVAVLTERAVRRAAGTERERRAG